MPDPKWQSDYQRIVHQARRSSISDLTEQGQQALADEYARQIRGLLDLARNTDFNSQTEQRLSALTREFGEALNRYSARSEVVIKDQAERAAMAAADAHRNGLNGAAQAVGAEVEASFTGVPERAMEEMFIRRGLGMTDSYKTLTRFSAQASAEAVDEAIADLIAGGATPQEAVEAAMQGLVEGNPQAEQIIKSLGPRGGLRKGVQLPDIEDARKIARKISFNARRIVLTENATAFHEADRLSAVESDVIEAVKWTLSAAHPRRDICDVLATQDIYGLGEGVYPAEVVPSKPHPFDLCSLSYEFLEPEDWGEQVDFDEPAELSQTTIKDVLSRQKGDPTDREVETTTAAFNDMNKNSFDHWTQEA